jgi:hypothetical protein
VLQVEKRRVGVRGRGGHADVGGDLDHWRFTVPPRPNASPAEPIDSPSLRDAIVAGHGEAVP